MIEGSFDARTFANMNVALDRVCERSPLGEQHDIRERARMALSNAQKAAGSR